jgi:hypothetical protein
MLSERFHFGECISLEVKGKSEEITVYTVEDS